MSPNVGTIYCLVDPRDSVIRYVGQTAKSTYARLFDHIYKAKHGEKSHKANWIREILKAELKPEIYILEDEIPIEYLSEKEQHWFNYLKNRGASLTNTGEFTANRRGIKHSEEQKLKISLGNKGIPKPKTSEHRRKLSEALKYPPEKFICPICLSEFELSGRKLTSIKVGHKMGRSGPFCSRRCSGINANKFSQQIRCES